jgi:TraM recognition site of TraD and TraG
MQRALESRLFISAILAMATGAYLFYAHPFPNEQIFLRVIALRAPQAFLSFKYLYYILLFTTPYLGCSAVLSGFYIFTLKARRPISPGRLPSYPDPDKRADLFLVIGEVHNPRKPAPAAAPSWLTIPERGLFTGIAILGAIGSGKTSCCMLPFAEQILAYKANDKNKRIGGLVLEVKGDFCRKVKDILGRHQRAEDYVEISLDSEYCYNPLHNDLDAYALAYNIASLLNNLFGRGKEPFWQQAYTNLVKFIILLHKVAYDYVTFFDIYQCAISPPLLEERIAEAEDIVLGRHYVAISPKVYGERTADIVGLGFVHDEKEDCFVATATPELRDILRIRSVPFEARSVLDPTQANPEKLAQLEAVKRWFFDDWKRIEPKLRTSIVEGVSVFLSLFDDNPKVKRVFCPEKECYDLQKNAKNQLGKPLPSFSSLLEQGFVCALNFPIGMNAGLAKALGVMMKLDFERAVLNRVPKIEAHPEQYFRQVLFLCDEYQHFATVGESDPTGDEKFFSLSRQPKCIPIIATQSISSLRSALPGESWRTLFQTFRTKIFLSLSDDFSARTASDLCGREDQLKVNGKALSHKANIVASKSYNTQSDYRFDIKTFLELRNAQAVVIAYDGINPSPPMFCYLKPCYNDPNDSYFVQLAKGKL